MTAAFESGVFYKEPAWHGFGHVAERELSIVEACALAGLNWEVVRQGVYRYGDDGELVELPDVKALVRDSDSSYLGSCTATWMPLQNRDAFNWFEPFLQERVARIESAGSLKGGKWVWVLAKLDLEAETVRDRDEIRPYLLLSNPHVCGNSVQVRFTAVRVVCWNTLSASLAEAGEAERSIYRIGHYSNIQDRLTEVQASLGLLGAAYSASIGQYRQMAEAPMSEGEFGEFIRAVLSVEQERKIEDIRPWTTLLALFHEGAGNRGESVWDGYNAITEWTSHVRGRSEENRAFNSWYGDSRRIVEQAHNVALALAAA